MATLGLHLEGSLASAHADEAWPAAEGAAGGLAGAAALAGPGILAAMLGMMALRCDAACTAASSAQWPDATAAPARGDG